MPYNISVGWNAREFERGMKGDGPEREGKDERPVVKFTVE